jgi:hypothetical protein
VQGEVRTDGEERGHGRQPMRVDPGEAAEPQTLGAHARRSHVKPEQKNQAGGKHRRGGSERSPIDPDVEARAAAATPDRRVAPCARGHDAISFHDCLLDSMWKRRVRGA